MNTAIILAGGKSSRFIRHTGTGKKGARNKLLAPVLGYPLVYHTIRALHDHPQIDRIVIAASEKLTGEIKRIVKKYRFPRVKAIVRGGKERQGSLASAMKAIKDLDPTPEQNEIIIVHNAANPLVTVKEITAVINAAKKRKAAAVGGKVKDTIHEVSKGRHVRTYDRGKLAAMQTPQAARYGLLKRALEKAKKQKKVFTDESSLLDNSGIRTAHVPASPHNFKVTTYHDYEHVKVIMGDVPEDWLVGIGQDSHTFSATQKGLKLGGILLKNRKKLEADSDGDVILHALFNAVSQALGEGSLGRIATPMLKEKGITKSGKYLEPLFRKVKSKGYALNNIGLMIEAKTPAIDPLAPRLKKSLSSITGLSAARIGITATSGDGMTLFGRGEGIQCFAIVSLKKDEG